MARQHKHRFDRHPVDRDARYWITRIEHSTATERTTLTMQCMCGHEAQVKTKNPDPGRWPELAKQLAERQNKSD